MRNTEEMAMRETEGVVVERKIVQIVRSVVGRKEEENRAKPERLIDCLNFNYARIKGEREREKGRERELELENIILQGL